MFIKDSNNISVINVGGKAIIFYKVVWGLIRGNHIASPEAPPRTPERIEKCSKEIFNNNENFVNFSKNENFTRIFSENSAQNLEKLMMHLYIYGSGSGAPRISEFIKNFYEKKTMETCKFWKILMNYENLLFLEANLNKNFR